MDRVAFDFRERVAALWKCCDSGYHYDGCVHKRVPDCEWTMKSKKQGILFYIGHDSGEWSYRFTNPDRTEGAQESLSMDELKKNPNLKNVRIVDIDVINPLHSMHVLRSRAEIKRLMKFVIFLSNEPKLDLCTWNVKDFDSPEGAFLLNFLSTMLFSSICASYDYPVYNRILENQFSRRRPTAFRINQFLRNSEFFIEHLGNGNIKRFTGPWNFRFPAEVMERIIDRFLENPENCGKNKFHIKAQFEESTKEILERKLAEGLCEKVVHASKASTEYRFTVNNPMLEKNPCLRIEHSLSRMRISIC